MRKSLLIVTLLVVAVMSGCATKPSKIQAAYVSPLKYKDYDCDMIAIEQTSIERQTNKLYHSLKGEADKDAAQMGIGLILFWPTLFFLEGGDGPEAAEYAQLKGEYDALQDVAVTKKCELEFEENLEHVVVEGKK